MCVRVCGCEDVCVCTKNRSWKIIRKRQMNGALSHDSALQGYTGPGTT